MPKFSGHGGFWAIGDPLLERPAVLVHNALYMVTTEVELKQSRSTNCGGWTEGLPVVRRVESATFRVAEDDVSYPQVLGFTEGAELPLVYLRRGGLVPFQFDALVRTVVQSVHVENDNRGRARWVEVVCQHGAYYRQVPAPAF